MKRIAASLGLVALGTSALQAVDAGALSTMQGTKPWSVSVALRGFYDSNINTSPNNEVGSAGFSVNPFIGFGMAWDQSSASVSYDLNANYYDKRPAGQDGNWDFTHTFAAALSHTFSPRVQMAVRDSFVIGQEPDTLRAGDAYATLQRIPGNNIVNYGSITANIEVTQLLGFEVGYANSWYNYEASGATFSPTIIPGVDNISGSNSGILDRIGNLAHIDSRWNFRPETVGVLGYAYSQTLYTGDEYIGGTTINPVTSQMRNNRGSYFYAGVDQTFSPDLSGSLRAGGRYTDFYQDPNTAGGSWTPYVQASMKYFYRSASSVEVGLTYDRSASDIVGGGAGTGGAFVTDSDTLVAYASLTHQITSKLYGTLIATYQNQTYNGGGSQYDGKVDQYYIFGANLSYRFNPHYSANLGYNFDGLSSQLPGRDFTRNRVYAGVTAAY
jgi:hypothetical protein